MTPMHMFSQVSSVRRNSHHLISSNPMSIAVVMTTLYSPVIESILFGFLELAIHHNCMTVYGCMFCCSKSHMYVIYIVRAFTLILVISCHFMFFQTNERKKTNAKREMYLQNAERQANDRRRKNLCQENCHIYDDTHRCSEIIGTCSETK